MHLSACLRVFCVLAAAVGFHTATTPPHPPPRRDENVPATGLECLLRQRVGQSIVKIICWSAALAELATALAHIPSWTHAPALPAPLARAQCATAMRAAPGIAFLAGTLLTALGGCARRACYRALGPLFTFELAIRAGHRLVTRGPYAVVRHPGYTGVLLAVAGTVLWHAGPGSWARECGVFETAAGRVAAGTYVGLTTAIIVGLISRMPLEDAALRAVFGAEWDAWAERVPYRLVPGVY